MHLNAHNQLTITSISTYSLNGCMKAKDEKLSQ